MIEQHLDDVLRKVSQLLVQKQLRVATAESCTGGLIGHMLTNVSGSSAYYLCGLITYSNAAKHQLLGVPNETLQSYGAVSKQVAQAMAEAMRTLSHVDITVSTTGIAGPTGGTKEKPVGLVYIAVAGPSGTNVQSFQFHGNRLEIKQQTCHAALTMLYEELTGHF
jgi:nicotinamide-nucleotide amidase